MAIFAGLKVKIGTLNDRGPALIPIHITYGAKDRVVAHIFGDNTQNKPIRLPAMSAYMNGLEMAPDKRKGVGVTRREVFMPSGGQFPDDIRTIEQLMPVPYNAIFDLSIYTSNRDEHLQILEQIMMFFNPILQIQKTDQTFDWTKITTVELMNINFEENYPAGTDRRIIQTTCQFMVPIYIGVPTKIRNNWIADINLRVGVVESIQGTSGDIIAELDELGYDYQEIFNLRRDYLGEEDEEEEIPEEGPTPPPDTGSPLQPEPPLPEGSPIPVGSPLPGSPNAPAPAGGRNTLTLDTLILTQGLP
jgi:hypothetical protein